MRLDKDFFTRDVLEVAPDLLGVYLTRAHEDKTLVRGIITEVEAYRGEEDLACHARFGRTSRTEVMYGPAGRVYVYLIYGMHWMLNIVTGTVNQPQAVLIRGVWVDGDELLSGPGKVGRWLALDKGFYGEDVTTSQRIWLVTDDEGWGTRYKIEQTQRVGIDYAGEWAKKPWRWKLQV